MKTGMIILKTGKAVLRGIYSLMKVRPVRKKVTILSRQSDEPSMDITLLADYLRAKHPDMRVVTLCRMVEGHNAIGYGAHMLRQMWHMADSAVIAIDGYCIAASILDHNRKTSVLQMWHSSAAIKKFGYQTIGMAGGHSEQISEVMCMHRNYDYILCPSVATGRFFCEAFRADESKLLFMALPRIDLIVDSEDREKTLRKEYGIPDGNEILLYAPTLRKAAELRLDDLVDALDEEDLTVVICPHPLDRSSCLTDEKLIAEDRIIIDRRHGALEWYPECDRVITDYSAVSVEASLTGKPVYFYVYDIDEYEEMEGLNVDVRAEVPELTAEDADSLVSLLKADYPYDALGRFRDRYFETDTDNCTSRLGEFIYGLAEKNH